MRHVGNDCGRNFLVMGKICTLLANVLGLSLLRGKIIAGQKIVKALTDNRLLGCVNC
jgi:hypothetical protein